MPQTVKVAAVQMDIAIFEKGHNLARIVEFLRAAAQAGAQLIVFPECALTGYCFASLSEALPLTETVPGPSTERIAAECRRLSVWAVVGMLEHAGEAVFNAAVLIGPEGVMGCYRKIHLPCLGVDRFVTPGNRPFRVYETPIGRIGVNICYDAAFPESSRVMALDGADVIVLPTNWPDKAFRVPRYVIPTRAFENRVNYVACNRIGTERNTAFLGHSIIVDFQGDVVSAGSPDREEVLCAELDITGARDKRIVFVPGEYEMERFRDRRPTYYRRIVETS
ncbi:MAG: carbon-nitrogen hydrolase family protein [Abditibacteriales bacterium]|nr:carbon-nitrogen hydrolase family protein [Abditibacteriales bacterium]MDW8367377.1 carbon-nitrogen hydrolase family protein [Abditibacteriales bacterium]